MPQNLPERRQSETVSQVPVGIGGMAVGMIGCAVLTGIALTQWLNAAHENTVLQKENTFLSASVSSLAAEKNKALGDWLSLNDQLLECRLQLIPRAANAGPSGLPVRTETNSKAQGSAAS